MRILIVEDDPMVRTINKGFAKKIDATFKIFEAENITEAKKILEREPVDVILLDVYLGESHGPDLMGWARSKGLDVDVILITADNSSETISQVFRLGAIDYLIKPFTFKRFEESINKVVLRRSKLKMQSEIDQETLDRFIQSKSDTLIVEKGINPMTYKLVESIIKSSEAPLRAQDIADQTDLARVTVRRYLEQMVNEGNVEETLEYGKVGRPQKHYKWLN